MKETPVNKIMENTLEKMRQMVDTSTIIGEPMVTGTTTLIPVLRFHTDLLQVVQTFRQSKIKSFSAVAAVAVSPSHLLLLSLLKTASAE